MGAPVQGKATDEAPAELLSATVGEAGTYRVVVRVQGGDSSTCQIAIACDTWDWFSFKANAEIKVTHNSSGASKYRVSSSLIQ